ncbi:retroviral-like aspartic protease family protein [Qipengyuania sp. G39]|uniref:Retroviral-like aspartic protease family protein n=1 Tax=Qipengyuania profundimaris TaxID=3067652 RepID=A0ABT9HS77_9SPHN|nr:retroviral-like aspartic protease family protein [Qipengyuania sp. G39]MDP4576006.1 retroviral-like aspartic protease family protein [Qipengyuania sp. G39]
MARRSLAAILALGLATTASAQPDQVEDVIGDAPSDEATLTADRHKRMTVPVTIAGEGPYRFLIDTGAQATVVTHQLVEDLALRRSGTATLVAMGSSRQVETVELDDLEFANRSVSGLISPLLHTSNIGADGILGLDSLQDTRVLIDFRERRMAIADAEYEESNSGYEIVVRARKKLGQMVITDARIDGVRTAVVIDTGAQNSIANPVLLRKLRARERHEIVSVDVLGTQLTSRATFLRSLQIGRAEMTNVQIGFADSPIFAALGLSRRPALVLGMNNLRVFDRVAIDFSTKRILFDMPSRRAKRDDLREDMPG